MLFEYWIQICCWSFEDDEDNEDNDETGTEG